MLHSNVSPFRASNDLLRSSHSFNVVGGNGLLFGGEIEPRKPVDTAVHAVDLETGSSSIVCASNTSGKTPSPRVGHVAATLGNDIYVFGGRSGVDPAPLQEEGRVWKYSTTKGSWNALDVERGSSYPSSRSYHSATASSELGQVYIHAGCPTSGRTSDVWAFDVASPAWRQLPSAPDPARGAPGFTYALGRLWRFGGFDGKKQQGGQLDYLDVRERDASWKTLAFNEDKSEVPSPRSVAGMLRVEIAGKTYLVLFLGEKDASGTHDIAGKFLDDVWALQISGGTVDEGKARWEQVKLDQPLKSRGWFAADRLGEDAIVLYGGVDEHNVRQSDGYVLRFYDT